MASLQGSESPQSRLTSAARSLRDICIEEVAQQLGRPLNLCPSRIFTAAGQLPAELCEALWCELSRMRLLDERTFCLLWTAVWARPRSALSLRDCVYVDMRKAAGSLASTCAALSSICLKGTRTGVSELRLICSSCTGIAALDLGGCLDVGTVSLQAVSQGLRSLESLSVSGCWRVDSLLPLRGLTSLRQLNASGCHQLRDGDLAATLEGLTALESFKASRCPFVTEEGIAPLFRRGAGGATLRTLAVGQTAVGARLWRLLEAGGGALTSLDVGSSSQDAAGHLEEMGGFLRRRASASAGCGALRHLGIARPSARRWSGAGEGLHEALAQLGAAGGSLESLDASRVTRGTAAAVIVALPALFPGIRSLSLASCPLSPDELRPLLNLSALEDVDLRGCRMERVRRVELGKRMRQPGRSAGADYSGVFADLLGMRRLRSVCLAETLVDDRALGSARGLRWLDVSSCPRVTETGILQVLMHCPELTGLDCSRCGEARGDMLGPHCPRGLRDLRLPKHAPGVACLESLLLGGRARRPRPRALRRLELEGCASGRGAWDARHRGLLRPGHPDSGDERRCPAASAELTDDHVGLLAASAPCLGVSEGLAPPVQ